MVLSHQLSLGMYFLINGFSNQELNTPIIINKIIVSYCHVASIDFFINMFSKSRPLNLVFFKLLSNQIGPLKLRNHMPIALNKRLFKRQNFFIKH